MRAVGAAMASGASAPQAQDEQVIVTGTRSTNIRARQSISPVVILSGKALTSSGFLNLSNALTREYPSIDTTPRGHNTNALTAFLQMRGLSPNEVLVLVDGKRRHETANIVQKAGPQFASSAVDLNMIPSNMIDHIEILEDGAAAMYGSDAIAGVVNIITKKKNHGLNLSGQTGADAYNGGGWSYQFNADGGLKLGRDGFAHISGQVYHTDHMIAYSTDHGTLGYWPAGADTSGYCTGVVPGCKAGGKDQNYVNIPEETRENLGIDFGKPITEDVDLYGQVIYAHRHAEILEGYEYPNENWVRNFPKVLTLYPNGPKPITMLDENDYAATLGLKGRNFLGFTWDLSTTWGADSDRIGEKDTVNTGMLASTCNPVDRDSAFYSTDGCGWSPTKAWDYDEKDAQWTNNLDFHRHFGGAVPVGLSFGAEQRLDEYQIVSGNPDAYQAGGVEGHAGIPPQSAGQWHRDVWAGYVDVTLHPVKNLIVDLAGRYESYTDTKDTETGKISARYDFTPRVAIRGTFSNGFRAPTLQEEHFSRMNVYVNSVRGWLPVNSSAAQILGATPLKPERSTNASGGFVLEPVDRFHVEVDAYQINLRDRLVAGGTISGEPALLAVENFGFAIPPSASNVNNFNAYFLSNGASTRTQGLDIKSDYTVLMHRYGNLNLSMALNLNRTRLTHNGVSSLGKPLLNAQQIGYLTTAYPRSKIILNAHWVVGRWDVNVRQTRFGETTNMLEYQDWEPSTAICPLNGKPKQYSSACFGQFVNTPVWLTDLQIGYQINSLLHVAVGANNIFNQRPRLVPPQLHESEGPQYDQDSAQVPINGAYYFGRINAVF